MKKGSRTRSRILDAGQSKEIGRKEVDLSAGLPGFGTGIITAFFQMAGSSEWTTDRLKRAVRKDIARGPKCLRWTIEIPSGPTAVEFLALTIAALVASSVTGEKEGSSFFFLFFRMTRRVRGSVA